MNAIAQARARLRALDGPPPRPRRDARSGFSSLGEFAQAVHAASSPVPVVDARLRLSPPGDMHHTSGAAGEGYLVPPAFTGEIWRAVFGEGPDVDLLQLVAPDLTVRNAVELDADETTPWAPFGVQAYWRHEAEQMAATKLSHEPRSLRLHELYAFVLATQELINDAPRLRAHLSRKAPAAIRWKASVALMHGTGAGQPLGWLEAPGTVTVDPEIGQAAGTVTAMNVATMFSRMLAGAIAESVWLVHSDVLPQLIGMTIGGKPVWTPPARGLQAAPSGYLFGRPLVPSEHCSALGDRGDIQFVAPRPGYYCPVKTLGENPADLLQFDNSIHLYFDYGIEAFRWTFRLNGQPHLSAPVVPAHGGATKGHFVALGART